MEKSRKENWVKKKSIDRLKAKLEKRLRQFDKVKRRTGDGSWPIKMGRAA